jgi:hypothetical protein
MLQSLLLLLRGLLLDAEGGWHSRIGSQMLLSKVDGLRLAGRVRVRVIHAWLLLLLLLRLLLHDLGLRLLLLLRSSRLLLSGGGSRLILIKHGLLLLLYHMLLLPHLHVGHTGVDFDIR